MKVIKALAYIVRYLRIRLLKRTVKFNCFIHLPGRIILSGNIIFEKNATLSEGDYLVTNESGVIKVGKGVYLGRDVKIVSRCRIEIGENSMFGPNVIIYDHDHKIINGEISRSCFNSDSVIIGKCCWIGAGAIILKGSNIGDGSIVGAGTVIKGTIPANSVVYNKQNIITKPF